MNMLTWIENLSRENKLQILIVLAGTIALYVVIAVVFKTFWKHNRFETFRRVFRRTTLPILILFSASLMKLKVFDDALGLQEFSEITAKGSTLLFILGITWLFLSLLKMVKNLVLVNYSLQAENNLRARSIHTQFNLMEQIVVFLVVIVALGLALMTFDEIRQLGISLFATAGVAGIILGFSAQRLIATILAGIQIAITQPIKLDDVVIVEGEWGRIEEMTLTYIVVRIWDDRRLVVPTPYFIERPFQNWTKTSSDLKGTVFLYTDYTVEVDLIRAELGRILEQTDLWDGRVGIVQVTDAKPDTMELRLMVTARDAPTAFDLRVHVREKMIEFLQKNYPEFLPRTRVEIKGDPDASQREGNASLL